MLIEAILGPLSEIVASKVQDEVAAFKSEFFKIRNGLVQSPAHQAIAKAALNIISDLKDPLRLLDVVCNGAMRERHWEKVRQFNIYIYIYIFKYLLQLIFR
jgi:hypothetical protein